MTCVSGYWGGRSTGETRRQGVINAAALAAARAASLWGSRGYLRGLPRLRFGGTSSSSFADGVGITEADGPESNTSFAGGRGVIERVSCGGVAGIETERPRRTSEVAASSIPSVDRCAWTGWDAGASKGFLRGLPRGRLTGGDGVSGTGSKCAGIREGPDADLTGVECIGMGALAVATSAESPRDIGVALRCREPTKAV